MNKVPQKNDMDSSNSLGKFLRSKRKEANLSVEDVAKTNHLDAKIIKALEDDDYSNMPHAVYVRGYLRNYAKTLNINPAEISGFHDANSQPIDKVSSKIYPIENINKNNKLLGVFTFIILFVLIIMSLVWYKNKDTNTFHNVKYEEPKPTVDNPNKINNTNINFDVVFHPNGWRFPEPIKEKEIENIVKEELDDNKNYKHSSIKLTINKDSWVEIYNKYDERIFTKLCKAGEVYNINNIAPFLVIIGVPEGVEIEFNNKIFNLLPHIKNGIARFKLDLENQ